jgi:hypothetical protein
MLASVISLSSYLLVNKCSENTGDQNSGNVLEMIQIALPTYLKLIICEFASLIVLGYDLLKIKVYC